MPLKNDPGQSYKATIRTFGSSLVHTQLIALTFILQLKFSQIHTQLIAFGFFLQSK